MSYRVQYLNSRGEWCDVGCRRYVREKATSGLKCEQVAQFLSREMQVYEGVPIRTLYGDSDSPVSVYVNGDNVRECWIDGDFGHPHLQVTV